VLPIDRDAGCQGVVSLNAHFRSEDARLCDPGAVAEGCLVLRGEIVQCSYPGGFYRYAVRVGAEQQYLVDDARRLPLGDAIGIALPLTALHFYPQHKAQTDNG
jgi:putative spermidine/putrescine transport system ATP-binding protein